MIDRLRKTRLGFDLSPRPSGPGRYLSAIIDAIDPDEFDVIVFGDLIVDECRPHVRYLDQHQRGGTDSPSASVANNEAGGSAALTRRRRIPLPRALSLWVGFHRDAQRFSRRIRAEDIDIFHVQNTGCEESAVAARRAGGPRVLGTFHVDTTYDLVPEHSSMKYRVLESYSNRCLHKAIAVSEGTRQYWMRRTGIADDRIIRIHNGINPDKFARKTSRQEARRKLGIPDDGRIILGGVGRLDVAKGFTYLVDAMAALRNKIPNVFLVIAGSGPLERSLAIQVAASGLQNSVCFLGYCNDVELVYDALDVFVLSSICDAMPFALLEAMAHELPAVGTEVGGVPEVIVTDKTGFLASPRNGAALAEAICPLVTSPELRERQGRAGRERVVRHFHETDMVRKTLDVYRRMSDTGKP